MTARSISLFALLVSIPLLVSAASDNDPYRLCRDTALTNRYIAEARNNQQHLQDMIAAYEQYAQRLEATKGLNSLEARKDARRDAKDQYNDVRKDARKRLRDRNDAIRELYSNERKDCKAMKESRRNEGNRGTRKNEGIGDVCLHAGECRSDLRCSTERGDCQRICKDPNEICILICAGRCERT